MPSPKSIVGAAWGGCALGAVINYARHGAVITAGSEQAEKPASDLTRERGVWASDGTLTNDASLLIDLGPLAAHHLTRVHALGLRRINASPKARIRWRALSTPLPEVVTTPVVSGPWTIRSGNSLDLTFNDPQGALEDDAHLDLEMRTAGFDGLADVTVEILGGFTNEILTEQISVAGTSGRWHQFLFFPPDSVTARITNNAPVDLVLEDAAVVYEQVGALWRRGWESVVGEGLQDLEEQTLDVISAFDADPVDAAAFLRPEEHTDPITTARYWDITILDGLNPAGEISAKQLLIGPAFTEITVRSKPKLREIPHTRSLKPLHDAPREIAYARSREISFDVRTPIEPATRIFGALWRRDEPFLLRLLPGSEPFSPIVLVGRFGKERSLTFTGSGRNTGSVEGKVLVSL